MVSEAGPREEKREATMEERIRPTKSGLFSIELLICVGVFVFCAAVCTGIFVRAELMSWDSAELNRAVNAARSVSECYQSAGGDLDRVAALCGGSLVKDALIIHDAEFTLWLTPLESEGYAAAELTVWREDTALMTWTVAALEVLP